MSLKSIYETFLRAPDATALAPRATLNYITTLTTINDAEPIIKHLASQHKALVKKKDEKILSAVEGPASLCLDVEVTLEFLTGGGAYLPGLDDNFLTDRIITLPMIHVVQFSQNKIESIRLYWDQGSLLKQLDVIGSRGRNWPIRDGKDQVKLIAVVTKNATPSAGSSTEAKTVTTDLNAPMTPSAAMSPMKKHIRDPHASLALFDPEETARHNNAQTPGTAARASAKPAPRPYHELFAGADDSDVTPTKPSSPKKEHIQKENIQKVIAPKAGGGKNYQASRVFGVEGESHLPPDALYKSSSAKYNHFEFGDGSDEPPHAQAKPIPMRPGSKGRHQTQWDFADFTTPDRPRGKVRGQDVRHFGWSDDEGELAGSPGKNPRVVNPRRDAETHFEFQDDGTPGGDKRPAGLPRGAMHNAGMGLYENNLYDENGTPSEVKQQPLNTITNAVNRKKDFGSQFDMTDSSPASKGKVGNENRPMADNRQKAVKMMEANWDSFDQSPEQAAQKPKKGHLRKDTARHWGLDDDSEAESGKASNKAQSAGGKSFWDF